MNPDKLRQLSRIDWDFVSNDMRESSAIHAYQGSYPAAIPRALIEILSAPGDCVMDPFAGSGTTAIVATALGRSSVCADISPVAMLVGYVSTGVSFLQHSAPSVARDLIAHIRWLVSGNIEGVSLRESGPDQFLTGFLHPSPSDVVAKILKRPPRIDTLSSWYHPSTLGQMTKILEKASESSSGFVMLLAMTMCSSVARAASSQNQSWGHVADKVLPKVLVNKDCTALCTAWLQRLESKYSGSRLCSLDKHIQSFHYLGDARELDNSCHKPALVVTSPPYGGAIDYVLAHRLSLYFFGFSDAEIDQLLVSELGARRKRFKKCHLTDWTEQTLVALERASQCIDVGYFCVVLPHKDLARESLEFELIERLQRQQWNLACRSERSIRQSRARQSWTSITREAVLVFDK